MGFVNSLRIVIAFILIKAVRVPWRVGERLFRRPFPIIDHYVIMRIFRCLASHFPVTIRYLNPTSKEQQSITLSLDLCENNQLWYFRMRGHYEREWIRVISQAMNYAESFIDVGANIGVFALTIAQTHPDRSVVAIEPLLPNYLKLQENVLLNHLSNIKSYQAAVADDHHPISFYVNPIHDGGGSIIQPTDYRTAEVRIDAAKYRTSHPNFVAIEQVDSLRLDDVITAQSVVKIDVEGAELSALASGKRSLNSGLIDVMVVEVTDTTIGEVFAFLDEVGFDSFIWGQQSPMAMGSQVDWKLLNLLCLRRQSPIYRTMSDLVQEKA
jgi:FkbM family methyltransferase